MTDDPRPADSASTSSQEPDREALLRALDEVECPHVSLSWSCRACAVDAVLALLPTPPAPGGEDAGPRMVDPNTCTNPACPNACEHPHQYGAGCVTEDDPAPGGGDTDLRAEVSRERQMIHEDIAAILRALGLGDHARPYSTHDVVHRDILPALAARDTDQGAGALAEVADVLRKHHTTNPDLPRWLAALGAGS